MEKAKGAVGQPGPGRGNKNAVVLRDRVLSAPKLADLGITRDESALWQRLAAIPERDMRTAETHRTNQTHASDLPQPPKIRPPRSDEPNGRAPRLPLSARRKPRPCLVCGRPRLSTGPGD